MHEAMSRSAGFATDTRAYIGGPVNAAATDRKPSALEDKLMGIIASVERLQARIRELREKVVPIAAPLPPSPELTGGGRPSFGHTPVANLLGRLDGEIGNCTESLDQITASLEL